MKTTDIREIFGVNLHFRPIARHIQFCGVNLVRDAASTLSDMQLDSFLRIDGPSRTDNGGHTNGHTVPAIETLEKMARALEIPMYQMFYDGDEPPKLPNLPERKSSDKDGWGSTGKDARYLNKLRRVLGKSADEDRKLILHMAQKMARR